MFNDKIFDFLISVNFYPPPPLLHQHRKRMHRLKMNMEAFANFLVRFFFFSKRTLTRTSSFFRENPHLFLGDGRVILT